MKGYNHIEIEKKWQKEWAKKKAFLTSETTKKPKFYVLDMFPYPSGEGLHVGHPKGYIATDIVSRMKRMQGFNVLHPMGFDAFGLPAENYAIKTKTNPAVSVAKNIKTFKKQLEKIGLDYDWSREVNTTDPKFYKWTQWIFLKLLEKGLAYESNEPVNWCPVDKTVLANEDVENGRCERCGSLVEKRPIRQWVLKITDYADRMLSDLDALDWPESIKESQRNWIGKSIGAEINFEVSKNPQIIKVFTTRPDTIFGATYVVLAPEHKLVKELWSQVENKMEVQDYIDSVKNKTEIDRNTEGKDKVGVELRGIFAINPANKEKVPIWLADYVLASYGTGAIMAVPAHDERDFEFAQKYNISVKHVVIPNRVDHKNPHVPGKKLVFRNAVLVIVKNPKTNKILLLKWKKQPWTTFIMGGIEEGENSVEAARREVLEETGYKNIKLIRVLGGTTQSNFFAAHKDVNRVARTQSILFELENEERRTVSEEEKDQHEAVWMSEDEITPEKITHIETDLILQRIKSGNDIYTGSGVLINSGKFNDLDSETAKKEIVKFVRGKWVTKYKLRDWVFSRQRYWGEPIPVLHDGNKIVPVKEKDLPVILPKVKSYEPTGTAESPLANVPNWINVKVGNKILKRESNTMPQWAGSSWYYLRYMDPKNDKALVGEKKEKYWNTVDLYVGGAEHATRHLIYARFWHKFLYDIGVVSTKEPFERLQNVGLIIASDGRKMSKRFGNIINPDTIVKNFGADSLRLYEMFMGPFNQSVAWGEENIIGVRRFLDRVWRLKEKVSKKGKSNSKIETALNKTIEKVTSDIGNFAFNTAVSGMMILLNEMEMEEVINQKDYELLLKILSPFAPHITEEIWRSLGHKSLLVLEAWPVADKSKMYESEVKIVIQINGKVRATFITSPGTTEEEITIKVKLLPDVQKWLLNKEIKKVIFVPDRLVNFVI